MSGAGIGLAQNHIKDYVGLGVLYPTHPAYPAGATGNFLMDPAPLPSKTTYNLAWAVMAGVAVDIGYGFKLDAGYRYAHLGDVKTGYEFGIGTKLKALDAHEARIGVRYMID
jgi:opacity protein-like surface antigen